MHDRRGPGSAGGSSSTRQDGAAPGRRTLTEQLDSATPGRRTLTEALPVQSKATSMAAATPEGVQQIANEGVAHADGALPFAGQIQAAFGRHDVSGVRAAVGGTGGDAARAIGAQAYATGDRVAFDGAPDLHTAAHEAAHVVQQRAGVALSGGVGASGDPYERHADAVADAVVSGRSAETLLDQHAGGSGRSSAVQRISTAPSGQPEPAANADVFSATDAQAVKDNWAQHGSETETDSQVKTSQFRAWMGHASTAIAAAQKAKTITAEHAKELRDWVSKFDAHEKWKVNATGNEPEDPGAIPADLPTLTQGASTLGNPPPAYVKAKQYDVTTVDGDKRTYTDHVQSPNTTSDTGVGDAGKTGGATKISDVFDKAGVPSPDPATVKKVFTILSSLEGKFDAINTYDAGYISAGFIQFISGKDGSGSLAKVLLDMKAKAPAEFNTYFHSVGIDVDAKGVVVVDPADGSVLHGAPAVKKVMDDKRLTAAFQAAGAKSSEFQYAQARTAYAMYYVPDLSFTIALTVQDPADPNKKKKVNLSGKYGDVLKSEAGKVASVDRGVQHGTGRGHGAAGQFLDACQAIVTKHKLDDSVDVATLATYEAEIVPKMHNRYAESADGTLTQPPAPPAPPTTVAGQP